MVRGEVIVPRYVFPNAAAAAWHSAAETTGYNPSPHGVSPDDTMEKAGVVAGVGAGVGEGVGAGVGGSVGASHMQTC